MHVEKVKSTRFQKQLWTRVCPNVCPYHEIIASQKRRLRLPFGLWPLLKTRPGYTSQKSSKHAQLSFHSWRLVLDGICGLSTVDDPPRYPFARVVRTSDRSETVEWCSMLPSEVDVLFRHPMPYRFHIVRSVLYAHLEIAIAAVAGEIVVAPLSS